MAVTFILGRAGAGKTHFCRSAVLAELARPADDRRLILLVPEQASFQMERALATQAPGGGYWRAEVLSFSRLAQRVIEQTGGEPTVVGRDARALALRHVMAHSAQPWRAVRAAARTQGFYTELARLIEELLREDVSPAALQNAAERLPDAASVDKIQEIARAYAEYLAWLGRARLDAAARFALLRERLPRVEWLTDASIWVDGFAGFTGQESRTLVELARRAREVTISLLLDPAAPAVRNPRQPPDPLGLFQRTELTYQRLSGLFAEGGVAVTPPVELRPPALPRFSAAPILAALEAGLATPLDAHDHGDTGSATRTTAPRTPDSVPAAVRLCECATHRDELRAAARWIRAQVVDARGQLRFRDFAVIARDLGPFAPVVAEVFAEYEIPYFLDRRRPLRAHPLARLLPALLDATATDFDVEPMVGLLRTRLLPLARDDAEQLENIVVNQQVRGLAAWRRPAWELEPGAPPVSAFAPQRMQLTQALEPLSTRVGGQAGITGAHWAKTLYRVLQQLDVPRQIEGWVAEARRTRRWEAAETHRLAWGALCDLLQDLHDALGETVVSVGDLTAIIRSALGELTLGLAPPTLDQVLVSSIERSRHPDIKHAWVLAFNEGVFPARPPEDLLLSTTEREALSEAGLTVLPPHREEALSERLLAYIAFTRPSRSLTISYATVGDDGGELLPSPLLAEVARALPGLAPTGVPEHEPPVTVAELAREFLGVRRDPRRAPQRRRYEHLCTQVRQVPALAGPLDWLLRGVSYSNRPQPVGHYRRPASGPPQVVWDGSPSEVETFLQCPFKHFATYGLRLDAARGPRPLRWDLGEVAHELLADVTRRALRQGGDVRAVADEHWQEWLRAAIADFWQRQPGDQAERRPDFVFMGQVLAGFLHDVLAAHAARWRRGRFVPLLCETKFNADGGRDVLRGIELNLADGRPIRLHGQIDRADVCQDESRRWLLVYDYKSGRVGAVRGEFLTGPRLQLFTYLLALQQAFRDDASTRAAGVFVAPLYPDLKILGNDYAVDAAPAEQTMYLYRPRGLVEETAARLLDEQLGQSPSPVAQLQLRKDNEFYRSSDAASAAEIDQRIELAARTVRLAAEGICQGQIEIAPLLENHTLACRSCDFRPVCRFDPMYNTPRPAERALPRLNPETTPAGEQP